MNLIELDRALRQLRLSGMAAVLDTRLRQAHTEKVAPIDLVSALAADELRRRRDRLLERRHNSRASATRSARRIGRAGLLRPNGKAQCRCYPSEALVEADQRTLLRTFPAPHQRRRELRGIRSTHAMCVREFLREGADTLDRRHFVPRDTKQPQTPDCLDASGGIKVSFADESRERTPCFEWCAPPDDHPLQFAPQSTSLCRLGLRTTQRDNRTRIPEGHVSARLDPREPRRLRPPTRHHAGAVCSRMSAAACRYLCVSRRRRRGPHRRHRPGPR